MSSLRQLGRDLALGTRLLRRAPGFAATSILIVALGVGSATTVFSVVHGVVLRPPPYPEPDRLVAVWTLLPESSRRVMANPADHAEWRGRNVVFSDIALVRSIANVNLLGAGEPDGCSRRARRRISSPCSA